MSRSCSHIKGNGERCQGTPWRDDLCWSHHPDGREAHRQASQRGGIRSGEARRRNGSAGDSPPPPPGGISLRTIEDIAEVLDYAAALVVAGETKKGRALGYLSKIAANLIELERMGDALAKVREILKEQGRIPGHGGLGLIQ